MNAISHPSGSLREPNENVQRWAVLFFVIKLRRGLVVSDDIITDTLCCGGCWEKFAGQVTVISSIGEKGTPSRDRQKNGTHNIIIWAGLPEDRIKLVPQTSDVKLLYANLSRVVGGTLEKMEYKDMLFSLIHTGIQNLGLCPYQYFSGGFRPNEPTWLRAMCGWPSAIQKRQKVTT